MLQELKQQALYDDSDSSLSEERQYQALNQGIWQEEQILRFMVYASFNLAVFTSKFQRRTFKIFKEMAKFIGTRTPIQCRSQNQKLIKKNKSIHRTLKAFERQIGKLEFQEACRKHQGQLKMIQSERKKKRWVKAQKFISMYSQTSFSNDSSEEYNGQVKKEEEVVPLENHQKMPFNPFSLYAPSPLFGTPFS